MPESCQSDQISAALAKVRAPLFLARRSDSGGTLRLVLHTAESRSAKALGRQARAALKSDGVDCSLKVLVHRPNKLTRFRSLEGLMKRLHGGAIVYDPTQFVGRSEAIVELGAALRRALPGKITGLFVEAERRTLYVIVNRDSFAKDVEALSIERGKTTSIVAETFVRWQAANNSRLALATRIGFEPPAGAKLISVDTLTVRSVVRTLLRRGITRNAIKVGAASLFGLGALVPAFAGGPAVSEPNFSAIMAGKLFNSTHFGGESSPWGGVGIKGAVPLGEHFGAQGDAALGTNGYYGVGGHLFWRDPSYGLLGAFASYEKNSNSDMSRIGGEAEMYMNQFTVRGALAGQGGTKSGLFGKLDLVFYATPEFSVTGGIVTDPGATYGHVGFEWQPATAALSGMSIFADGQFGQANRTEFMAGLKFHFGGAGRTLIDRDRRDDPEFSLFHLALGYQ